MWTTHFSQFFPLYWFFNCLSYHIVLLIIWIPLLLILHVFCLKSQGYLMLQNVQLREHHDDMKQLPWWSFVTHKKDRRANISLFQSLISLLTRPQLMQVWQKNGTNIFWLQWGPIFTITLWFICSDFLNIFC